MIAAWLQFARVNAMDGMEEHQITMDARRVVWRAERWALLVASPLALAVFVKAYWSPATAPQPGDSPFLVSAILAVVTFFIAFALIKRVATSSPARRDPAVTRVVEQIKAGHR